MRMRELQQKFLGGEIEKKLYWTIMREQYTHILPELMELLQGHEECKSITITGNDVVLEKQSGVKMYFNFKESMSRAEIDLCDAMDPEKEDMLLISEICEKRNCKTMLDIGANVGMFSLEMYIKHPDMMYYLFEPIPTTYSNLLKTLKLNEVDESVMNPYNMGMSNREGTFKFYLPGESEAASLQPIDDAFYRKQSDEFGQYTNNTDMDEVKCRVTTVDDFVERNSLKTVDFIKIDVEGNEKFVLEGAKKTLKDHHPLVYCELLRKHAKRFGYHPNDVINFMNELGYGCYTVRNEKKTNIELVDDSTEETNFFFE